MAYTSKYKGQEIDDKLDNSYKVGINHIDSENETKMSIVCVDGIVSTVSSVSYVGDQTDSECNTYVTGTGKIGANEYVVNNHVTLHYDDNTASLQFIFE